MDCRDIVKNYDPNERDGWAAFVQATLDAGITVDDYLVEAGATGNNIHRWIHDGIKPRDRTRGLIKQAILVLLAKKEAA